MVRSEAGRNFRRGNRSCGLIWNLFANSSVDRSLVSFEGTEKNALAWEVDAVVHELP